MVRLMPMTQAEFQTYCEHAIPEYAQEHVKAGNWHPSQALQKAEQQYRQLLPDGVATKNHYLFSVEDGETGANVGMIWFAVDDKKPEPSAFIYDFRIDEGSRRRGYGTQVLRAVEEQAGKLGVHKISLHVFGHNRAARDLYEKVGYEITGIHMSKQVG